ncbi:MAG: TlpA family protein disulfide reductase [Ignavibacteria bacterium]|nr:TlpA family protein disulfide reductase [Ignavibacteria bacterium]
MNIIKKVIFLLLLLSFGRAYSQEIEPLKNEEMVKQIFQDNEKKIVVINLWAQWCQPCKIEMPGLVKFGKENADDMKLILVSLDDKKDLETKTKPFLKSCDVDFISYINAFDKDEKLIMMLDKNWEGAIPATFFYKDGVLVKSLIGMQDEKQFQKALNEVKKM